MSKISKVQLNGQLYSLKGDADNIKDVMSKTIQDIYSEIENGTDSETVALILLSLTDLLNSKADKSELSDIWDSVNSLRDLIPESTINYYFAYKVSTEVPERPSNDLVYVPLGWSSQPTIANLNEVLYMTMARTVNGEWLNWGDYRWTVPIAMSDKTLQTNDIETNIALYKLSLDVPELSDLLRRTPSYPQGWTTTPSFSTLGDKDVYMITAKMVNGNYVLQNNYYWSSPMRIGGNTTSTSGVDGDTYNYVYYPSNSTKTPSIPSFTVALIEDLSIEGWYDSPLGVSEDRMYEYISLSVGNDKNRSNWSPPVLWSKWGERGMDGDKVEYIYKLTSIQANNPSNLIQNYSLEFIESNTYLVDDFCPNDWTDNPSGVNSLYPYEYVAIRKKTNGEWQRFSTPALWAKYGKDGTGSLGLSGAVIRYIGDWSSVVENASNHEFSFECNTPEGANIRYIDVVTMLATGGGLDYYQCKEAYTTNTNSLSPDLDSTHWEPALHYKFLVTDALIANYIASNTISANDVIIKEGEGLSQSIVAGMTSSTAQHSTLGDVRIWAGTEGDLPNILDAPFVVNNKGGLYARDANIWGNINATSGSFSGNVAATSLSVIDNDKVLMLFMPAPGGIDNIPEGAPALFIFYNDQSYIVNMIPVNSLSGTVTTYTSKDYYVVIPGLESNMYTKLEQCHIYNGLKYYSEHVKAHNNSSIGLTLKQSYWYCNSNDGTINNRVFTDANKTQPLSGVCIDPSIYNEFTRDYNAASNTGTYKAFYLVWSYTDGIKAQLPGKIIIGTWHTTAGVIDHSDFLDIGVTQPYTAPALYSNYARPISYSELSTQMQISNRYASNPGQID